MSIADKLKTKVLDLFKKETPEDPNKTEDLERTDDVAKAVVRPKPQVSKNDLEEVLQTLPEDQYRAILSHGDQILSSIEGKKANHNSKHNPIPKDPEHTH